MIHSLKESNLFPIGHFKLAVLLISIIFCDCKSSSKYPGYTEVESGIFYQLHVPGDNGKKAGVSDYYELRMQNKYAGTIFYDSDYENSRGTLFMQSSSSKYLSVLEEGDSATFLLSGADLSLKNIPDTGLVEMNVKIVRILTKEEYEKIQNLADPDVNEQLLIQRYIEKNNFKTKPDSTGIYFIEQLIGKGAQPKLGNTLVVKYTGMLFNKHIFDSNGSTKDSYFSFTWGQSEQLIPGLILALSGMKVGGKAKIILPSPLAFGANGSTTGIVPPHTPVIYEVELISIEKN